MDDKIQIIETIKNELSALEMSRLQKVKTRKLQLAGTGERLMISNSYNRHNARSPVPARKNLLFAGDSYLKKIEYLLAPKVE